MKKVVALLLALVMVVALCACGPKEPTGGTPSTPGTETTPGGEQQPGGTGNELAGTYDVTLWVPEAAVDLTKEQVAAFNSSNELGITFNATVEPVSEADAATNMINDVSAGGDLYFFAQDQLSRLIQAGALTKLGQGAAEFVKNNNNAATQVAAQAGSDFYAYPLTSDNGYFMYYDKSVIPEEDVDSLEAIVADCEAADKNISFELENAWYLAGFFFSTGCHSDWVTDNDGNFISIDDDFNSANGIIALKGAYKVLSSPKYVNSSTPDFASGSAVVVTGTWNYAAIKEQLGDNFGVADLPSYEVDGTSYHIGSYSGCKLMGLKPQEDAKRGAALNQLAQYLTGTECQLQRFSSFGWGPSNNEALADPAVVADPTLTALNEQGAYAIPQPNIHGSWWDIAKVIAVIGAIGGSSWDVDFAMTADGDVWTSNDVFELKAGDEFKCRQGKSWDVAYPAENYVVEADGSYNIQLNAATGEITLVPAA